MRRHFTAKQKAQIVLEVLKEEKTISQIASEHGVHPNQLHRWKAQALDGLPRLFENDHKTGSALASRARKPSGTGSMWTRVGAAWAARRTAARGSGRPWGGQLAYDALGVSFWISVISRSLRTPMFTSSKMYLTMPSLSIST